MEFLDFTLRFDDDKHSLTSKNGLPMEQVGQILIALRKAINASAEDKIVLSEVRGNCYALQVSTSNVVVHEQLKVIHKKISSNEYSGLNHSQKEYAYCLKKIIDDKYELQAYDKGEEYKVVVRSIEIPVIPEHHFELGTVYGVVTGIGGRVLGGKASIRVSETNYDISVSSEQERSMLAHFKKHRLRLTVKKKVKTETGEVVSATLEDFEALSDESFSNMIRVFRNNNPDAFPGEDSSDAIRKLRNDD